MSIVTGMRRTADTTYVVRVQYRRQGQKPDYSRDVRFFNCESLAQAQATVKNQTGLPHAWRVELFALLEQYEV